MDHIDDLDIGFDMSLLDDDNFYNRNSSDGTKTFPNSVVNNDVSLLDTNWMSLTNVGKNMNNFAGDAFNGNDNAIPNYFGHSTPADHGSESDSDSLTGSEAPSPLLSEDGTFFAISDGELTSLSVKDLNSQVKEKGMSKEEAKRIKKRRRTLKNRGYAHSCRLKRLHEKSCLQEGKSNLEKKNSDLEHRILKVTAERDTLIQRMVKVRELFHAISQVYDLTPFTIRKGC